MKTSHLVGLIIALIISTGEFAAINFLFTSASSGHERPTATLNLRG
jgi:hypothetical protein